MRANAHGLMPPTLATEISIDDLYVAPPATNAILVTTRPCTHSAYVSVARGGVEPPTFRFSVGRSYQLSYLAVRAAMRPWPLVAAWRPRRDSNPRPPP